MNYSKSVAIIGAGLAGLTCAKVLLEHGVNMIEVYEREGSPGGRVRTDQRQGFKLDRGFQVLFSAYPSVQRHLDLQALEVCAYTPGAVLVQGDRHYPIGDPLRVPSSLWVSLSNPLLTLGDKLRVLALRAKLLARSIDSIWRQPDGSTLDFLKQQGFSEKSLNHFFYPFYSGIFLDPALTTSARLFQFYFKMLSEGSIITPKRGMGAITEQLAGHIPGDRLHLNTAVQQINHDGETVTGIVLENGQEIACEQVICATDAKAIARLLPGARFDPPIPTNPRQVNCLYFSSPISAHDGASIHLNGDRYRNGRHNGSLINHCIQLSNVSPALAPEGQHLISVTLLETPDWEADELVDAVAAELVRWFPQLQGDRLTFLHGYHIPFAQFEQPPGIHDRLPSPDTALKGLILAGEYLRQSSIEGAMYSGEWAARTVLESVKGS